MSLDVDTAEALPTAQAESRTARRRILVRLCAVVLMALLPALAIQSYNELELRASREAEVREDALGLAKFAFGELNRIIDNGHGLLVALADLPAVRSHDASGCSEYASGLKKAFPQYAVIGAIDRQGHPFCASAPIAADADASERPYFTRALATGEFTIGEYTVGKLVQRPVLPLALPFTGADQQIDGVAYISLDLEWLAQYFTQSKSLDSRETLAIADRSDTILVRIPDNSNFAGQKFADIYRRYVFASAPGTDEIVGVDGIVRILGYVPVSYPPTGLFVGVGVTKADAFAGVNSATRAGIIMIGVGLAVGLAVAWSVSRFLIVRPVEKLLQTAAQWAQGNFEARADLRRSGPVLMRLGRTFDAMAAQLLRQRQENASLLATLERRVEERTQVIETARAELASANAELQSEMRRREQAEEALRQAQKIEALGQLTGGVAHDFNNILQVILGSLNAARRRLAGGGSITLADGWERIQPAIGAAERAATLTQRLLAFARRQPLAPQTLDLNRMVAGMSNLLRQTLGETIAIETVLAGGLWSVSADANQLENAILNLAVNARDAMPEGGKLTIETANALLDEAYAASHEEVQPGQYVLLALTDSGTGMPRDVLLRAFDPFFTTKDVGHGTGLGLSQVYGFVKQSGGHIKIYSEPNHGTSVKMYLPRLLEAAAQPETTAPIEEVPGGLRGELILVAEDEADVRAATAAMVQELGYAVLEAADGPAALRLLAENPAVRLLFTDVGLPGGLNGRQLATEAVALRPGLLVLYTTGYARNAIVHHGMLDAGVELLVKPFTYAALAAKLRSLLDP
jgi:signal transduction histidine kinase